MRIFRKIKNFIQRGIRGWDDGEGKMTHVQKILKEAKAKGIKVDPEVKKGMKAIEKMHELTKKIKGSPSKVYKEMHS